MDERTLEAIEYPQALKLLAARCQSAPGQAAALSLRPAAEAAVVRVRLDETDEALDLMRMGEKLPLAPFEDPSPWLEDVRHRGGVLEPGQFLQILSFLNISAETSKFLEKNKERVPCLHGWIQDADLLRPLAAQIKRVLDERGEVRDDASTALRTARSQVRSYRNQIRRALERLIADHADMIQESVIVQRRDRYVVPAKTHFRRSFEGVVQDRSSSGETLFVEPLSAVPLNNALAEARDAEREEVFRILKALSTASLEGRDELADLAHRLVNLDLIQAKALLGRSWEGERPRLSEEGKISLRNARHPLLASGFGGVAPDKVVPIDIAFGGPVRQVIITGPNTGGKTVALKTVGLSVALNQTGVPIPVAPDSELPLVRSLFADIGDEQDLEQNLSTFSGHMTRIASAADQAGKGSLLLLDELGSGTDPAEGSAIGVAVLEHLARCGALSIVSTHHDALKHYAYESEEAVNASVEFDPHDLSPTYRIRMGAAGPSNAMAVAERLGLSPRILERAKELLSGGFVQVDRLMARLSDQESALEKKEKRLSNQRRRFRAEKSEFKRGYLKDAAAKREETDLFIKQLRREADDFLSEIRESGDFEAVKQAAREKIHGMTARVDEVLPASEAPSKGGVSPMVRLGDTIRLRSVGSTGIVRAIHGGNKLTVEVNGKALRVAADSVERVKTPVEPAPSRVVITHDIATPDDFSAELSVIGLRLGEALEKVEKYLDDAAVFGLEKGRIVHGKGEGVLAGAIAELLEDHPLVSSYAPAHPEEGGWGVTTVDLAGLNRASGGAS